MTWAQGILTLQPGVSALIADVHPIFKLHLVPRHDDLPGVSVHPPGARLERADLVSRPARLSGGAQRRRPRCAASRIRRSGRRCQPARPTRKSRPESRSAVSVNGVAIARDAIAREMQHHPAAKPIAAWQQAARALVVRELLLQRARRLDVTPEPVSDDGGRRETDDEAVDARRWSSAR